jgi:hypothetical protein
MNDLCMHGRVFVGCWSLVGQVRLCMDVSGLPAFVCLQIRIVSYVGCITAWPELHHMGIRISYYHTPVGQVIGST